MIENKDVMPVNYYNYGQPFTGSYRGMRYKIEKKSAEYDDKGGIVSPDVFKVTIWPEPFSYEKTDRNLMTVKEFPFSEEGKQEAVSWLNMSRETGQWHEGITLSELKRSVKE